MKYIVRHCGDRDISETLKEIPEAIVAEDTTHNGMDTFVYAMGLAGDDAALHMEDDVILCRDFKKKVDKIIAQYPNDVIQFFSMRGNDLTEGTRWVPGQYFIATLCFYLPKGMSKELHDYRQVWPGIEKDPTGFDLMLASLMKEKKMKYLNFVPNLVDHKIGKSMVNPKRTAKRVSKTFKYADLVN